MIQPTRTTYNGYQFKTELEARWAVFFDTLKIRYEHKTYEYKNGIYPIFWLPDHQYWIETKNQMPTDEEYEKASLLLTQTKQRVVLAVGEIKMPPDDDAEYPYTETSFYTSMFAYYPDAYIDNPEARLYPDSPIEKWSQCEGCGHIQLAAHWTLKCTNPSCLKIQADKIEQRINELRSLFDGVGIEKESQEVDRIFLQERRMKLLKEGNGELLHATPHLIAAYTAALQTRF